MIMTDITKSVENKKQEEEVTSLVDLILSVERGQAQLIESLQVKNKSKVRLEAYSATGDDQITLYAPNFTFELENLFVSTPSAATNVTLTIDDVVIPLTAGVVSSTPKGKIIPKTSKIILNYSPASEAYLFLSGTILATEGRLE